MACLLKPGVKQFWGHRSKFQPGPRHILGQTHADDLQAEGSGLDGPDDGDANEDSVVFPTSVMRLKCVRDRPRFDVPVLLGSLSSTTRTAVAISYRERRFLLTSAGAIRLDLPETHSSSSSSTALKRVKPVKATALHIGMECDLAVLQIPAPPSDAEGTNPERFVKGSISQISVMGYASAMYSFLALKIITRAGKDQIGAPVLNAEGSCLGLVVGRQRQSGGQGSRLGLEVGRLHSSGGQGQSVEYSALAVPSVVIKQFLDGIIAHQAHIGFPSLGIKFKKLEALALKKYLGLKDDQHGILICDLHPHSDATSVLRTSDVLTKINGNEVGSDGMMAFRGSERILCTHFISMQPGEELEVQVIADVPARLIPTHLDNKLPPFLVVSGLIFTRCSVPYMESVFGRGWVTHSPPLLVTKLTDWPRQPGEDVVVIAEMLELDSLAGYEAKIVQNRRVVSFNGTPVVSLKQLAKEVLRCADRRARGKNVGKRRQTDLAGSGE
eukprot:gene8030-1262_t